MPRVEIDIASGDALVPGGEPNVHGTVRAVDGPAIEFQGWVGLVALLQQALVAPPAEVDPS